MQSRTRIVLTALSASVASCGWQTDSEVIAVEIERQVVAAHPDVSLDRFARFYARESDGTVTAIYLFANEGYEPIVGKAGKRWWTSPESLPAVYDGGCAVLNIKYDIAGQKLNSVECNGAA